MNLYILDWTEYERGWGCRPDGLQVFSSSQKMMEVLEKDSAQRSISVQVPDCYSIPTIKYICEIDDLNQIMNGKEVVWFTEAGKRDIEYLKKTFKSLKVLATENLK